MASSRGTAEFIAGQAGATARPMFGELALYRDGILVALVCDDRLFLKPTDAGRSDPDLADAAAPYPGATPHLVVPPALWDDGERLATLFRGTAAALPPPKIKRKTTRKTTRKAETA